MDIEYTDEQRLLSDTLDDLLAKRYDHNARLRLLAGDPGWSRELWSRYAELGLLGLPFAEKYGGAGMGVAELAVVMESFGRALVLEPYLATVVLAGQLVARSGTLEQKAAVLPALAAGELLLAFGHTEPNSRWSLTDLVTTAEPDGTGWAVTGQKIAVLGGDCADRIVVSARTPDGEIGLFLVDGAAVERSSYAFQDGLRGADLVFRGAPAEALGTPLDAGEAIGAVIDTATAALCAEAVGAMERMLWITVDYLKTRVQFGAPIAVFQALQHRAADMYVALEQARSMALLARLAMSSEDVADRRRTVRAAKIQVDLSSRLIGQEAIQLHGGIGMTMEYPVGHYVKRTAVIARTFADVDELLESVGTEGGLIPAA
jgi:alkylation response protein AidB-like acyl-CoA dehydrogenase